MNEKVIKFIEEFDALLHSEKIDAARKYLEESLRDAKKTKDNELTFTILNEMEGFYRNNSLENECFEAVDEVLELLEVLKLGDTAQRGTAYVNVATCYNAFSRTEESIGYYKLALDIYLKTLDSKDYRLAALYNNMGFAYSRLGQVEIAKESYYKAIDILEHDLKYQINIAVTYVNIASLYENNIEKEDEIRLNLMKAYEMLTSDRITKDGYYAFNIRKCVGVYEYNGFFKLANDLTQIADKVVSDLREES